MWWLEKVTKPRSRAASFFSAVRYVSRMQMALTVGKCLIGRGCKWGLYLFRVGLWTTASRKVLLSALW